VFKKVITIPPLRERAEDILPLANYFIGELLRKKVVDRRLGLSPSAEQAMTAYNFPGNVRELEEVIFHASIVACAEGAPVIEGGKMAEAIEAGRWKRSEPGCARASQKEGRLDIAIET
jgi:transcriptional regulator with PAS, ATPase and Fis domain